MKDMDLFDRPMPLWAPSFSVARRFVEGELHLPMRMFRLLLNENSVCGLRCHGPILALAAPPPMPTGQEGRDAYVSLEILRCGGHEIEWVESGFTPFHDAVRKLAWLIFDEQDELDPVAARVEQACGNILSSVGLKPWSHASFLRDRWERLAEELDAEAVRIEQGRWSPFFISRDECLLEEVRVTSAKVRLSGVNLPVLFPGGNPFS